MFCSRGLYVLLSTPASIFETSCLAEDIKPVSLRQNRISGRLFILSFVCAKFYQMLFFKSSCPEDHLFPRDPLVQGDPFVQEDALAWR